METKLAFPQEVIDYYNETIDSCKILNLDNAIDPHMLQGTPEFHKTYRKLINHIAEGLNSGLIFHITDSDFSKMVEICLRDGVVYWDYLDKSFVVDTVRLTARVEKVNQFVLSMRNRGGNNLFFGLDDKGDD